MPRLSRHSCNFTGNKLGGPRRSILVGRCFKPSQISRLGRKVENAPCVCRAIADRYGDVQQRGEKCKEQEYQKEEGLQTH